MEKHLLFRGFTTNGKTIVEGLLKSINKDNATILNCNNEDIIVDKYTLGRYLTDIETNETTYRLYSGDVIKCAYEDVESGVRFLTKDYEHLKAAKYVYSTTYYDYLNDSFNTIAWFEDESGIMLLNDIVNQFNVNTNFTKYMSMKNHTVYHIKDKEFSEIFKYLDYDSFLIFKYYFKFKPCTIKKLDDFDFVIIDTDIKIPLNKLDVPVYTIIYGKDKNDNIIHRAITNNGTNSFLFSTFESFINKSDNETLKSLLSKIKSTNKINEYSKIRMDYIYDNINYLSNYKYFTLRMNVEYKEFYYLKNSDIAKGNSENDIYYINIPNSLMKKIAIEEMNSRLTDENQFSLDKLKDLYEELFATI